MNAFQLHETVIANYREYLKSFIRIRDRRIREYVEKKFEEKSFIPEPIMQFNPSYQRGESLEDLRARGVIHPGLLQVFGGFRLYRHQVMGIERGVAGKSFVVTSGTGSGKSLIFLATIFDHIFRLGEKKGKGVKAVLVYPMNALINSQEEEIKKYELNYLLQFVPESDRTVFDPKAEENRDATLDDLLTGIRQVTAERFPVTYRKYTGQESEEEREEMHFNPPDIILTNYMMLELIMTRCREGWMRESFRKHLKYLVFDELHTYRGRQGADVSMLIRRIRALAENPLVCIGTSATMVSGAQTVNKKEAVAAVASSIFGENFPEDNIIGEYLENITEGDAVPDKLMLRKALKRTIDKDAPAEEFVRHPLVVWLENRIALKRDERGALERGEPRTFSQIVKILAEETETDERACRNVLQNLLDWAEKLSVESGKAQSYRSYLPYKMHQFISQTSTVYVTLDPPETRAISIETGRYHKEGDTGEEKYIYPVLFSRMSGYEFICVRKNFETGRLEPRDPDDLPMPVTRDDLKRDKELGKPRRNLGEEDLPDGYLILPDPEGEPLWSDEDITDLPQSWWKEKNGGIEVDNYYLYRLPHKVYFDAAGNFSSEPLYDRWGWFMPAKLLFDPTAGIVYDMRTSENTKLMRLGNEGRSTATTITAFSVISELYRQKEKENNRKLLSFTDNRQDASLQAGHFNDFITTGRLRSALYHALREAQDHRLKVTQLEERITGYLGLRESEYARNPNDEWPDPENLRALKDYLLIRIFYDLKKGWRFNMPNLEQTALLQIDYDRLDAFCEREDFFQDLLLFDRLGPEERKKILVQVLNYFRTAYALDHPLLTTQRSEKESFIKTKLDPDLLWSLDKNERIEVPFYLVARSPGETGKYVYTASLGPNSYMGKYFKRLFRQRGMEPLKGNDHSDFMERVCEVLRTANLLVADEVRGRKGTVRGYRLRVDNIVWRLGDGKTVLPDEVRIAAYKKYRPEPNEFFRKFYQVDFRTFGRQFVGKEHTGQLSNEDRIEREKAFREGRLSALFCSPTMELGIDIADLNIVHLRNVPPTPANYVQRSGRAGRTGQAAVIFNYCSNYSPHDRYYFKNPVKMVSGAVVPPRIELLNEELILTHFNAYLLMRLEINQLRVSVKEVLDLDKKDLLPLREEIRNAMISRLLEWQEIWVKEFRQLLEEGVPEIKTAPWYSGVWLESQARGFISRFDGAFDRWRILYKTALDIIQKARHTLDDPVVKHGSSTWREANRQHAIGMAQRALLLNESRRQYGNESEFYVFRYLASEGFLPGYNFTRLPVRVFVGHKHQDEGEYISRSRFIALSEFGPNNLIYHKGNKFRINRILLSDAALKLRKIKISQETGYAFLDKDVDRYNNDPITQTPFKDVKHTSAWNNLLEITETEATPQERISSEEEERSRMGFEIDQYFNYPKGMGSTLQAVIREGAQPLLHLIYYQSTQLIQVNKKWRRSRDGEGFLIDKRNGRWLRRRDLNDPETSEHSSEVKLFARDTADTLYIQPVKDLGLDNDQVVSLAYALKRAIEQKFEVEENEVGVWIMGREEEPNIMLYEAAEGSLGVLSQLISTPSEMKDLFRQAYRLMHYDPEKREDIRPDLPKATYDDLLSYYNQRYHDQLDRHAVSGTLARLMDCEIVPLRQKRSREEQYRYLLERYDKNSATERELLDFLYENNYLLPDEAQVNMKDFYINADFVYQTPNGDVLVFCDGSVHDEEEVIQDDQNKRQFLRNAGYDVIEWHYTEPLEKLVERRRDVFRKL